MSRNLACHLSLPMFLGLALPCVLSAQIPDRLERELPRLIQAAEIPGIQAAWIDHGRVVWTGGFGVRDASNGAPVTDATVFEAASLSKPVVAYATLRLVGRGELSLDDPLWDEEGYERLAHDARSRSITPRMVLTHTTGLPNWGDTPLELNHDPGSTWGYSGEGFVFLATMLERRTGMSLNALLRREVFEPLGMSQSSFVWEKQFDSVAAVPHDLLARPQSKRKPTDENAAASLHTTAGDYARFVTAVLNGEGLESELAEMLWKPFVQVSARGEDGEGETDPHVGWGLGWGVQDGDADRAIWHWGDNGNFRCFVIAYPERQQGLVYFTNSNSGLSIAEDVVSLAFTDTHWSVRWLDYWKWDRTQRLARIELRRGFLNGDSDDAWSRYEYWHAENPDDIGDEELGNLGRFLMDEEKPETGLAVLARRASDFPSAAALVGLAEGQTVLGDYEAALTDYQRAIEFDADQANELEPRVAWLRDGIAAANKTVRMSEAQLREFVGEYGPRKITLQGGKLRYQRDNGDPTRLIPMSTSVFRLESSNTFRIRFERDAVGSVVKIVGLYSDGRTDESLKSN